MEFLNNYASTLVNVFNTCDYSLLWNYVFKFRHPNTFTSTFLIIGNETIQSTRYGIQDVGNHMWCRMNESPDSVFTMDNVRVTFDASDNCVIKLNYVISGTKYVRSSITSDLKSMTETDWQSKNSNASSDNADSVISTDIDPDFMEVLDSLVENPTEFQIDFNLPHHTTLINLPPTRSDDVSQSQIGSHTTTNNLFKHPIDKQSAEPFQNHIENGYDLSLLDAASMTTSIESTTPTYVSHGIENLKPIKIEYHGECTLLIDQSLHITGVIYTVYPSATPVPIH